MAEPYPRRHTNSEAPETRQKITPHRGRVTVRDDSHSIEVVLYPDCDTSVSASDTPVSVTVTVAPLYALTIAGQLIDAATRALYRRA